MFLQVSQAIDRKWEYNKYRFLWTSLDNLIYSVDQEWELPNCKKRGKFLPCPLSYNCKFLATTGRGKGEAEIFRGKDGNIDLFIYCYYEVIMVKKIIKSFKLLMLRD